MCLSTIFWSKVQKFCTHLQANQSEYKKNVLYHINNIGLLDHEYVPIYNFLEHGTNILYLSTILLVRIQKDCTLSHTKMLGFVTINMYSSTTFWSKEGGFVMYLAT